MNYRTNNALVQTFNVNNLNELTTGSRSGTFTVAGATSEPKAVNPGDYGVTSVTVSGTGLNLGAANLYTDGSWARSGATLANGINLYNATATDSYGRTAQDTTIVNLPATSTFSYDANGNLVSDGQRYFAYDDENELISVTMSNAWRSEFSYDGLMRRRIRKEFTWSGAAWTKTNEVRYVYDNRLVIQERDGNNLPLVTYTRGDDLGGSLEAAGGIGGLLFTGRIERKPARYGGTSVRSPKGGRSTKMNGEQTSLWRMAADCRERTHRSPRRHVFRAFAAVEQPVKSNAVSTIRTFNVELGLPRLEEARRLVLGQIRRAARERVRVLKVIHGYGSSGRGGSLCHGLRKSFRLRKKEGMIKDFIPGEDFSIFNGATLALLEAVPEARHDPDLGATNEGITILWLR